jgi:hypothetical protein
VRFCLYLYPNPNPNPPVLIPKQLGFGIQQNLSATLLWFYNHEAARQGAGAGSKLLLSISAAAAAAAAGYGDGKVANRDSSIS